MRFTVTTQTGVNQSRLLHSNGEQFQTNSLLKAVDVYKKEVEYMEESLTRLDKLSFEPTDIEVGHAYYCSIKTVVDDEVLCLEESDLYFNGAEM